MGLSCLFSFYSTNELTNIRLHSCFITFLLISFRKDTNINKILSSKYLYILESIIFTYTGVLFLSLLDI